MRQTLIRTKTRLLVRHAKDAVPLASMIRDLDELHNTAMAEAIRLLETGRDATDAARAAGLRDESLKVQDKILEALKAMLARLQRNEQAKDALRKLAKTDKPAHNQVTKCSRK